ncbi:hypothetical protein [Bartonella tamiae]|uniref:hypothetical protein n=1 Tax=Bartonella tamiae TaxID=373638 RepID=UPI00026E77A9|nr:hypothetical protein [Bartonella tamiae]EJF92648.1 hypothetical protein MEG_01818 [Bartonella tamiae Th307]
MLVNIAEYRPDVADINTDATDNIRNVLPADGSYIPMPNFKPFTQSFPEKPLSAFATRALDGGTTVFVGTETKLYTLNNTDLSWSEIGKEDYKYSAPSDIGWSFASFGDYVIAVNPNDPPQVIDLKGGTRFRDLGGNPPRASMVKIWGDFVCLMGLPDNPNRVHWSGLNNIEHWTVGEKNSDYQDFPDGGRVQGSNEATNPIIFLQSAIYMGTFVAGSDIVFSFQKVHDKKGAKSSKSIVSRGAYTFFADEGGFFQISTDGSINGIGFEKVDRTYFTLLNSSNISEMYGAIDPFYNRVYWAMDYNGSGRFNEMLIYDWGLQRWSVISIVATAVMPIYTAGYTLDGLDAISLNVDALPFSLDSKAWQGSAPILGAFSTDYRLGSFTGEAMEAVVTSQELGATDGSIQRLESVFPVIDTDECSLRVGGRFRRSRYEPIVWKDKTVPSYNTGRYHKRSRARFHRFELTVPTGASWSHIKGFDVTFSQAGFR